MILPSLSDVSVIPNSALAASLLNRVTRKCPRLGEGLRRAPCSGIELRLGSCSGIELQPVESCDVKKRCLNVAKYKQIILILI